MAVTPWSAWHDDVISTTRCPVNVATMKIRAAAIYFCKRSRLWRYWGITPLDAVANQQSYVISALNGSLPLGRVIADVLQARFDDAPLTGRTLKEFYGLSDTWYSDSGDPTDYTVSGEGEVSFYKIPATNGVGLIRFPEVALAPSQDAVDIDSAIYERYRDAIAIGARALIHEIQGTPYTDENLAQDLMRRFNALIGATGARAARGRGAGRLRTAFILR